MVRQATDVNDKSHYSVSFDFLQLISDETFPRRRHCTRQMKDVASPMANTESAKSSGRTERATYFRRNFRQLPGPKRSLRWKAFSNNCASKFFTVLQKINSKPRVVAHVAIYWGSVDNSICWKISRLKVWSARNCEFQISRTNGRVRLAHEYKMRAI